MKKLSLLFWLILSGLCHLNLLQAQHISQKDEFETLMQKIRQDFAQNPDITQGMEKYNAQDGSFTDVDYASIQRTNWPPLVHINRISDFVFAYTNPENRYYQNEDLYNKIEKGLEYWHERNPWCHNWWYNQIAEPQALGVLLIQMRTGKKQLPHELESKLLERIKKDGGNPAKWTGANRTDIALHWIYRACLSKDAETLEFALKNVYSPVVYTTKEGFQHDNSNFQHGQQLYIGGYGDEILKGVTQVAMYTRGTRFAMPQEKLKLISKFMRETYYPTIRGKYMLFDVMGRSVSRPGVPDKSHTALFAQRMEILDTAHAQEFREIISRLKEEKPADYAIKPQHTHYFRGDYSLHVRPENTFDVRLVSNRTARCEYGNGENLKTYFMSDGCTNIVRRGNEYEGIFPSWNWSRIPGTTAPQLKEIPLAASDWQTPGTSDFAGGVSDSLYGVTTYRYMDNYKDIQTGAHKAWFFFDEEIVCLGANISSTASEKVYTTVNQCLASSELASISLSGKLQPMEQGEKHYKNPEWIWHDGIGYLFPKGGNIVAGQQIQSGSWYDINHSINRKEEIQNDVFTVCIDHGLQPKSGNYAYIVLPDKKTPEAVKKYSRNNLVEILQNDADIQAVRHKGLHIWQIVFYRAGRFQHKEMSIEVDKPCALMIKQTQGHAPVLHIADPGQTGQAINVIIHPRKKKAYIICMQPAENPIYAGATQSFILQ